MTSIDIVKDIKELEKTEKKKNHIKKGRKSKCHPFSN